MLCFTHSFLCANPETDEFNNEVLPENVVVPLSYSGPLSMPSALPQYEVTPGVHSLNKRSCNEVLPENVVEPLSYSGPLSKPSALSQHEATSRTLSLSEQMYKKVSQNESYYKKTSQDEPKYKKASLNEMTYKKDFQNESKFKQDSQGEIKTKGLSQSKMANPSLSLFTYLPLSTEGAGGALTGHSTAAHRSLRSLPPALESGTMETKEIGLLSKFSASITKALSGVLCVKKEMAKTFRPGVARIFKHLPSECQQNENRSYLDDDLPVCRDILVNRGAKIFPPMSRELSLIHI